MTRPDYRTSEETKMIREVLAEVAGRIPVPPRVLFERLRAEIGDDICERRLWRALRWNVERGELIRVGEPQSDDAAYKRAPAARMARVA